MINFLDTSAVLEGAYTKYSNIHISTTVLMELENIKNSNKSEHIKYLARQAVRDIISFKSINKEIISQTKINKLIKKYNFLNDIPDHRILCEALLISKKEPCTFITSDNVQYLFASQMKPLIPQLYEHKEINNKDFQGWSNYYPTTEELTSLYSNPTINILNCKTNEFAKIYVENDLKDVLFWDGTRYRNLKFQNFTSVLGENIKPRNLEQKMYLDLLQNKNIPIKLCIAKFGTGKSFLALNYALNAIEQGRFDKIIFVKNNLEVKGAGTLGTLPGDATSKQYPWLLQVADHVGLQKFEEYLDNDILEPAHLSTLRGRDLKNCIILVDEAENLLSTNIQLLIGRIAENSEIIFCADIKQCDYQDETKSGIPKMIERLAGQPLFGMVKLMKTERSIAAAYADYLD